MSSSYLTTDPQPPTGIQLLDLPMLRRKFGHSHYAVLADQEVHSYILYGWKNGKWTQVGSITGFCARWMLKEEDAQDVDQSLDYVTLHSARGPVEELSAVEGALVQVGVLERTKYEGSDTLYTPKGSPVYKFRLKAAQVAHQCFLCLKTELDLGAAANADRFRRCSGCKQAYYCSEKCQQAHWKRTRESHKLECHALSERNFIYAWEFRKKQEGREIMDRTMAAKGMKPVSISGGQGESAAPRVVDFGGITIVD